MSEVRTQSAVPDVAAARLMRRATYAAVGVAGVLVLLKVAAYLITGSVALLSSLIDSALDAAASLVNLVAVRQALQPADPEHRFGHGKAEPLAGLGQAAFISGSSVFLIVEALGRLLSPAPVTEGGVGIAVMLFAIVATFVLVGYQRHVVARTGSVAIAADGVHYTGDVLINLSVIASIVLADYLGFGYADPLFALAIAAYLLFNARGIFRSSLDLLMDRELPDADRARILSMARAHPQVVDAHDLRTRSSGQQTFIQLHLEMAPHLPLVEAHAVAEQVAAQIRGSYPRADVLIHQDPAGLAERHHDALAYRDRAAAPVVAPQHPGSGE